MSYMCTLRIKSKQTSYRKVRLDVVWGKCEVVNDISGTKKLLEDSNMTFAVLY